MRNVNRSVMAFSGAAAVFTFTCVCMLASSTSAQAVATMQQRTGDKQVTGVAAASSPMKGYRDVAIGMSAAEVESTWGEPKVEDDAGFLYNLSGSETAQIELDPNKKVVAIAIMFKAGKGAPSLTEVFGDGAIPDREQDGTVYKMVRYPEAGYWVSYYAGSGDNATTTLTMRKL